MTSEYDNTFTTGLEWVWGPGFLSPGGSEEVATLLDGIDISGLRVLDVGCGLGGVDICLVENHHAAQVVGIDVLPHLVERCNRLFAEKRLDERLSAMTVEPGPLPFDNESFPVIFSKDSILHIPEKQSFYAEVLRVLSPGGYFICSDWLSGTADEYSTVMQEWLDQAKLDFAMKNADQTTDSLTAAGFELLAVRDRNAWYATTIKQEIALATGADGEKLAELIGREAAVHRLNSSTLKQQVIENGELRPTHLVCRKPLVVDSRSNPQVV